MVGKEFYDSLEQGVGEYFWNSLMGDIESLIIYSGIHEKRYGLFRMLCKRFPYAVYYEIADDKVYVLALLPMRRDPLWVKNKLQNRH